MEYGEVVLEHRPIVICQCEFSLCYICKIHKDEHTVECRTCGHFAHEHLSGKGKCSWHEYFIGENRPDVCTCEEYVESHPYYQRNRVTGPRVVIDNKTFRGVCFKCKKEYEVVVKNISDKVEGQVKYDEVVPY